MYASKYDHTFIIEALASQGATVTADQLLTLMKERKVQEILINRDNANVKGNVEKTALMIACENEYADLVEWFLKSGAYIDDVNYRGKIFIYHCYLLVRRDSPDACSVQRKDQNRSKTNFIWG